MERIQQSMRIANEGLHVKQVRTQVKDCVVLTQAEVVNRAGIFDGETLAKNEIGAGVKTVKIQIRLGGAEGNAKVEHLARRGVQLRMCGKGTNIVESATKIEFPTRLERDRVEFNRQPLLTESEKFSGIRIDANVDWRLEHYTALQTIGLECSSESAEERAPGFFLCRVLRTLNEAAGELYSRAVEAQGANHSIAIEPVVVMEIAARKARWTIHIVGAADELRNVTLNVLDNVRLLARRERKGALDQWCVVFHQSPPTPASSSASSSTAL